MESLDIEQIGPGAWYMIHMLAANSKTRQQIDGFVEMIDLISRHFFCPRCREHFHHNYRMFPPPRSNTDDELFIWTVEMHNRVNTVNGKTPVSYRDALNFYVAGGSSCNGDCSGKREQSTKIPGKLIDVLGSSKRFSQGKARYEL